MLRRRSVLGSALALLGLGAAALAAPATPRPTDAEKQQLFAQAPYTIAGTLTAAATGGQLQLLPYGASLSSTLRLDPSTPVYQGRGRVTVRALVQGLEVRLHYQPGATADQAQVKAVELLAPQEAELARRQPQRLAQLGSPAASAPPSGWRDAALRQASGSQVGRVKKLTGREFVLAPYRRAAGDSTLRMDPNAPVFQANQPLSTGVLQPGTDVRVFYETHAEGPPSVVAIELLDARQAARLERSERDLPPDAGQRPPPNE